MSCLNNIDPYNNIPPPRNGQNAPPPQFQPQPQFQSQNISMRTGPMSQRPVNTPNQIDPQTEIQLLMNDLEVAVNYIRQLGGVWPPPI